MKVLYTCNAYMVIGGMEMEMEYIATYMMESGHLCHVGAGHTIAMAIANAMRVIEVDGLYDAKTVLVHKGNKLVAHAEVEW